ncbi:MAG: Hsp20/alpha crystallin family protein [Phycisphaerae bacterium]|nr:Hsp20/alpha crystallin family protein [Phycisphaerae bacterium]
MLAKRNDLLPSFGDLRRDMNDLFERFFESKPGRDGLSTFGGEWTPPLDIEEKADTITVKAEVPGVDPAKIEVTVQDDLLTLKGSKEESHEEKDKNFFRSERRFGSFLRRIVLPSPVDESKVNATYKDGVLKIELTKNKAALPKRIPVAAARN